MKQLNVFTLAFGALSITSVLAAPSKHQHGHLHRSAEKKRQVDFDNPDLYTGINWSTIEWSRILGTPPTSTPEAATTTAAATTPTTEAASAVTPTATPSSSGSSSSSVSTSDGFGGRTDPVASDNVDTYLGNVGVPEGSNLITIAADLASTFTYTNQITNNLDTECQVIHWNKGYNGEPNAGQFSPAALTFTLGPGETQHVAYDQDSQGAFCCWDGSSKTSYGAYDCVYGEFDVGNTSNDQWSGADVSSIQTSSANVIPMQISAGGQTSSTSSNGYTSDTQAGGIGLNLAPGEVRFVTTFG